MITQRMTVLTLAADNLPAMRNFYEQKLGFVPAAVNEDIVFYQMNGFMLSITGRVFLAGVIGIEPEGSGFRATTISYNVQTEQEVWQLYEKVKDAEIKILKEPTAPPFGGLFFYFTDVEGNILEIACNDYIPLDDQGNAIGHKSIDHL